MPILSHFPSLIFLNIIYINYINKREHIIKLPDISDSFKKYKIY